MKQREREKDPVSLISQSGWQSTTGGGGGGWGGEGGRPGSVPDALTFREKQPNDKGL